MVLDKIEYPRTICEKSMLDFSKEGISSLFNSCRAVVVFALALTDVVRILRNYQPLTVGLSSACCLP